MGSLKFTLIILCIHFSSKALAAQFPMFDNLKSYAATHAPSIRSSLAIYEQKKAHVHTELGHWLPQLNAQILQTRSKDYSLLTSGMLGNLANSIQIGETDLKGWSLNLVFPVYRRSLVLGFSHAQAESEQAQLEYSTKQEEMLRELKRLFGNLLLAEYEHASLKTSIEIAKSNLKESELRMRLGQKTKIDVLRSQTNLLQLESSILEQNSKVSQAWHELVYFAGLDEGDSLASQIKSSYKTEPIIIHALDMLSDCDVLYAQVSPYLDRPKNELINRAMEQSGEAKLAQREFSVAELRASQLTSEHWPDLAIQGSISKKAQDWGTATNPEQQSSSVSAVLTIPLFSFGSSFASSAESGRAKVLAGLKRDQALSTLRAQIESQVIDIRSGKESLGSLRSAVEQAQELERLSFKSYQLGKTSLVELQESQKQLLEAKNRLAKVKMNLSVLISQFAWNIGVRLP